MALPKRKNTHASDHDSPYVDDQRSSAEIVPMPVTPQRAPQSAFDRIGDILRRERERRGDDLQQIADQLCIRRTYLAAIENSKYDEFPADIYVIGFLRSYAQYLGLDGQEVIDYYHHEMEGRRKKPALMVPVPISESRTPSVFILVGAAIAALMIYIAWYSFSTGDRTKVVVPPTTLPAITKTETPATITAPSAVIAPTNEAPATAPVTAAPESILPSTAAPVTSVSASKSQIVIKAEQTSWVKITNSQGQSLYDNIMKPGETHEITDAPGLKMTTGNIAGITISIDGKEVPKQSANAPKIANNVAVDIDMLKAKFH